MQAIRQISTLIAVWILAMLLFGCSSKGNGGIVSPVNTPPGNDDITPGSEGYSNYACLGAFEVILDTDNLAYEVNPVPRSASVIGDNFQLDATRFFTEEPCTNCFRLDSFGVDVTGDLYIDFGMKHPFSDTTKRLDLDAFDVKLILITNAEAAFNDTTFVLTGGVDTDDDGTPTDLRGNTNFVLNPDGYTTHLDAMAENVTLFPPLGLGLAGNLNPFKFFFIEDNPDILLEGSEIPNHRMVQGADWDYKRFMINYPTGGGRIRFLAVIEVAYGQSAVRYTRLFPVYWLPQFNQKEAYSIEVQDITNSLNTQYGSTTAIRVEALDWQHGYVEDINYPDSLNLIGLDYLSNIQVCTLEVPGVTANLLQVQAPGLGGSGHTGDPMIFEFTLTNESSPPVAEGVYPALICVTDSHNPSVISVEDNPEFLEYINDVRAYMIYPIHVYPMTNFNVIASLEGVDTGMTVQDPPYPNSLGGQADLAVYDDGIHSGVLMALMSSDVALNNDIVRFEIDYSNAPGGTWYAKGSKIIDGTGTHPGNTGILPNQAIYRIDAADTGAFMISNSDDNFTVLGDQVDPTYLLDIPNSALVRPYDMYGNESYYFVGGCGSAPGPSLGERVWEVFEDACDLGGDNPLVYLTGGPNTEGCGSTLDLYFIEEQYNHSAFRHSSLNYLLSPGPYNWADLAKIAGDCGTAYDGSTKYFWSLRPDIANPGIAAVNIIGDPTSDAEFFPSDILLNAVDLEVLEYDPDNPRSLNGVGQTSDWICVLYREGVVDIFDDQGVQMDRIDGRLGSGTEDDSSLSYGECMHLDVDDYLYRIHVTMDTNGRINPGGSILVSVFSL